MVTVPVQLSGSQLSGDPIPAPLNWCDIKPQRSVVAAAASTGNKRGSIREGLKEAAWMQNTAQV